MTPYYQERLSARRLERVYEIAPPRVKRYLSAEIDHVLGKLTPGAAVLELGCGYGRVLGPLARVAALACGIDTSLESLVYGRRAFERFPHCHLVQMDAARLAFRDGSFDCTVCIQNGISAFHVDAGELMRESIRVTRPGGLVLFSSYSDAFWDQRLEWFELQAREGLVGPIDREKTRDGRIVCTDGFTATTVDARRFAGLARDIGVRARIVEVDSSSIFCEIVPGEREGRDIDNER
jgi:2-polyprenyl-6-hydroxyphenyl methylase/3-demethylubiquinone-9 3-methyltransferase